MSKSSKSAPRRVFYGGNLVGSFELPPPLDGSKPPPELHLAVPPVWDDQTTVLMLLATQGRGAAPLPWRPASAKEFQEAQRLYDATHLRNWKDYQSLANQSRQDGRWVVRHVMLGHVQYLKTTDAAALAATGDDAPAVLSDDPKQAAVLSHDQAIALTRKMMERFEFGEDNDAVYFEPARLD